jgi:hypothetical protein
MPPFPQLGLLRSRLVIVLVTGTLVVLTPGCSLLFGHPERPRPTAAQEPPPPAQTMPNEELGACEDISSSVPPQDVAESIQALSRLVRGWPGPIPSGGASPPRPGLTITVRSIAADSFSPQGILAQGAVQGVPSVIGAGDPASSGFPTWHRAYLSQLAAAKAAAQRAQDQARSLAVRIGRLRPPVAYVSGIWPCVSAEAESFSGSGARVLLVVSDLKQTGPAAATGSLKGVRVLVAHICDAVASCEREETSWRAGLRRRGATDIRIVRFENLASALALALEAQP